jgi:small subunit ribosomal protein S17
MSSEQTNNTDIAAADGSGAGAAPGARGRGNRRTIQGTVTSTAMDKTVVVTVLRRLRDRRFHKFVSKRIKYKAHDERNECTVGDLVELVEARPYSKTKRWRVARTIERAREGMR